MPTQYTTYRSRLSGLSLVRAEVAEETKMQVFLVERGTALLALLQTQLGRGQFITQPRILTTHPLYLSFLPRLLGLDALHETLQRRHHLCTTNTSSTFLLTYGNSYVSTREKALVGSHLR